MSRFLCIGYMSAFLGLSSILCHLHFRSSSISWSTEAMCSVISILNWWLLCWSLFTSDWFYLPLDFPNKKRKRSRWNQDTMEQKTVIPGMPTVIPPGLTREQERAYIGKYTFCTQTYFQVITIYSEQYVTC